MPDLVQKRRIAHVIFRLDFGGLENGVVNLINRMPGDRFAHSVICLTGHSDFRARIQRGDVAVHILGKRPGNDLRALTRLWRLLRRLRPDIVHTHNLPTLDCVIPAVLAGVRCRIHGEHGWDVIDLHGTRVRYRVLRRLLAPMVTRFIAVSTHIEDWLVDTVGLSPAKVRQIYNGVDTDLFRPGPNGRSVLPAQAGFADEHCIVIGTVGRLQTVKDQTTLARAFIELLAMVPEARRRLRLVLVGEGPLAAEIRRLLEASGAQDCAWMPGTRTDVAELMRGLDVFVLPSLNEGISNSVLEAMASALPVVATDVGGNGELVRQDCNGILVPPGDPGALARAIARYVNDPRLRRRHGDAGRARALACFSLESMVKQYTAAYDTALARAH